MPEESIRFGIKDDDNNRSSTWKCFTRKGKGASDVYIACRNLGADLKASLHDSGRWHISYTDKFYQGNKEVIDLSGKTKYPISWDKPAPLVAGFILAYRIIIPNISIITPIQSGESSEITWIPKAKTKDATEIDLIITQKNRLVSSWPGKTSMRTELIGSMKLDNGDTFWAVSQEITMPIMEPKTGNARFFNGKSREDLEEGIFKVLMFSDQADGSMAVFDLPVQRKDSTEQDSSTVP